MDGPYQIENQWTGFYMVGITVKKELIENYKSNQFHLLQINW